MRPQSQVWRGLPCDRSRRSGVVCHATAVAGLAWFAMRPQSQVWRGLPCDRSRRSGVVCHATAVAGSARLDLLQLNGAEAVGLDGEGQEDDASAAFAVARLPGAALAVVDAH